MFRKPLTALATAIALAAVAPAAALAASPVITDPAGDALNKQGNNVLVADARSQTFSTDGTSLFLVTAVGDAALPGPFSTVKTLVASTFGTTDVIWNAGDGRPFYTNPLLQSSVMGTQATLLIEPYAGAASEGDPGALVTGTVTRNTSTDTITTVYALSDVNAGLASIGAPTPIAAGSTLLRPSLGITSTGGLFSNMAASDSTMPSTQSFTLTS